MFTKVGIFKTLFYKHITQNVIRKVKYVAKKTNSAFLQKLSGKFLLFLSTFVNNYNITM
jgi:hypothetical protein